MSRPIVVIPSCAKNIGGLTFDAVGRKYSAAVAEVAECQPLLIPLGASLADIGAVLDVADGILLSGSPLERRTGALQQPRTADQRRGHRPRARCRHAAADPRCGGKEGALFAICRGFQEFNVALGGTLHQAVHAVDGHNDHREPTAEDFDVKFGPKHTVKLQGELKSWVGKDQITVNSLHWQGIQKLAAPLVAEAFRRGRPGRGHPRAARTCILPWRAGGTSSGKPKNNPVSIELFRRLRRCRKNARIQRFRIMNTSSLSVEQAKEFLAANPTCNGSTRSCST